MEPAQQSATTPLPSRRSQRRRPLVTILALAAGIGGVSGFMVAAAGAQQARGSDGARQTVSEREQAEERLKQNRRDLDQNQQRVNSIEQEMARLKQERATLNEDLIRTGERVKDTESRMTGIEGRLETLETRERDVRKSLNAQYGSIARLLSSMQRMGRNPPPVMVTRRSDALEMVRSAMLMARAFPKMRGEAMLLSGKLQRLTAIMTRIRSESDALRAESKKLAADQVRVSELITAKQKSYASRDAELVEVNRTVKLIGSNVKSLEELIERLGPVIDRQTTAERQDDADRRRAELKEASENQLRGTKGLEAGTQVAMRTPRPYMPPAQHAPDPFKPKTTALRPPPQDSLLRPAINLTPEGGAFIGDTSRLKPAIPFHLAKGKLPMPAVGPIERDFGEETELGGRSKGITIKTRYGAQIRSPTDGWVVYAGKFRTYGQLLILKAGEGYHVLLAGLSRIDVHSGQFVLAAEPIGSMKSSSGDRTGKDSPRLYVEFRKGGRPINPRPWWYANSKQKVQG